LSNNPTISDHSPPSPPFPSRRRPITPIQAGSINPYTLLGVNKNSTITDIKKAYRKKALKLHPDVNKAPDAQERFLECKEAYATLIDIKQGTSSSNSNNSNNSRSSSSSGYNRRSTGGTSQYNKQRQEEDFYGFTDFLRDLDKEIDNYATKRRAKRPGGDTQGAPKSLWEEMADLGEEFLEFLEDGLTSEEEEKKKGVVDKDDGGARARRAPPPPPPSPPPPPPRAKQQQPPLNRKPSKEVIEDELSELKKKLGL
jgi:DnaJ-class molecular chaperone